MAGIPTGGQKLSPNTNVNAPAGIGGDQWGKFGGGIAAVGVSRPVAATLADGETCANYQPGAAQQTQSIAEQISDGALDRQALDSTIAGGGSSQG